MSENNPQLLQARHEILFLYDIRMGNPNGDPDENRPRQLPDGTFYVTDVRLKRFVRDYLQLREKPILVGKVEGTTTNLTGRVQAYLAETKQKEVKGEQLVSLLLDAFIDARLFGSSLAFKDWDVDPRPKTLTGPVQFNHGEVLHPAEEIQIKGTSVFASDEEKTQGTFTDYACLRYGLIGFSGIANEHSAKLSRLTEEDYALLQRALWNGVRAAGNTRTKTQQSPRLLLDVCYKAGVEYQIGNLINYVKLEGSGKEPRAWASCADYALDLGLLYERLAAAKRGADGQAIERIRAIRYAIEPDLKLKSAVPGEWTKIDLDD
jgi:CRISPR-associated protein Csh2